MSCNWIFVVTVGNLEYYLFRDEKMSTYNSNYFFQYQQNFNITWLDKSWGVRFFIQRHWLGTVSVLLSLSCQNCEETLTTPCVTVCIHIPIDVHVYIYMLYECKHCIYTLYIYTMYTLCIYTINIEFRDIYIIDTDYI